VRTNVPIVSAGGVAAAAIPALLLALAAPAEDWTIVSKTRFGSKEGTQTVFLAAGRMKTSGGGSDSIVDFKTGTLTFLDGEKSSYYVTSMQELDRYAAEREAQSKKSHYNEEGFGALVEPSAVKTGGSRRIAGHPCDDWTIRMGDGLVFEVCAARDLPAPRGYFEARAAAYAGMGPMGRHFRKMFEAMKQTRGYPLALAMHVKLEGMKQESSTEATEVKAGAIPPATFAVPADYARKPSPFTTK
jgi:Domain of unknown function (DUF4412)